MAGPTVRQVNEWTARAIALGLSDDRVRGLLHQEAGTLARDPDQPLALRHLEVEGEAPQLR